MLLILPHAIAAALYLGLGLYFFQTRWRNRPEIVVAQGSSGGSASRIGADGNFRAWERVLLTAAVLLHAALLAHDAAGGGVWRFGFAHALSSMALLALAFYGLESFFYPLDGMPALALPPAAVCVMMPAFFPGNLLMPEMLKPALVAHVGMAMLAYALFAIGAAHAVLMLLLEQRLHSPALRSAQSGGLAGMPPLLTMERLLFQALWAGFILLSLTLASGIVFSEEIFGRAMRVDHKTVFGILSWVIFGGLLAGRAVWGWRGRTALNGTFLGFAILLLAYVGSRFVLEVILKRM